MDSIIQEFDKKAASYETNRLSIWYKTHADILLKHIHPREDGLIVDIGCGTGYFLRQQAQKLTGSKGIGIDISQKMIRKAHMLNENEAISSLKFICRDFEQGDLSPIITEMATSVVCANTIHYFKNLKEALHRMYMVIDKGGELIILDRDMSGSIITQVWNVIHKHVLHDITAFYTKTSLFTALHDIGFTNVSVVEQFRKYFWKGKVYTSLFVIKAIK